MIRPNSFDAETIAELRRLVAVTYSRRDDLYAAAEQLNDEDLAVICRKLADDLAGNAAHLQQIIAMNGQDPSHEAVASALCGEIMQLLREDRGDGGIVSAVKEEEGDLREQYDAAIVATKAPDVQAVLAEQKRDVDFGERVLRQVSEGRDASAGTPKS